MQQDTTPDTVATATHDVQDKAARIIQKAFRKSRAQPSSPICLEVPVDHALKGENDPLCYEGDDTHPCVVILPGDSKKSGAEGEAHICSVEELCVPHRGKLSNVFATTASSGHFEAISAEKIAKLCGTTMKPPHVAASYMREEAAARTIQRYFRKWQAKRAASQSNI
jgi:hypothetical protein